MYATNEWVIGVGTWGIYRSFNLSNNLYMHPSLRAFQKQPACISYMGLPKTSRVSIRGFSNAVPWCCAKTQIAPLLRFAKVFILHLLLAKKNRIVANHKIMLFEKLKPPTQAPKSRYFKKECAMGFSRNCLRIRFVYQPGWQIYDSCPL